MAKTGTDYETWTGLTGKVSSSVAGIADLAALTFSTTTAKPFTSFNDEITKFNTTVGKLKTFTTSDVTHMNQAAENKVTDDRNQAEAE